MSASNRLFAEGLTRLGLTGGKPLLRCEVQCDGGGRCAFVCPRDAKQSVNLNLLRRAREHGMRAVVETQAVGLNMTDRRVVGLVCRTAAGGRLMVYAKRFILAMGTFATPYFLLRNGVRRLYPALGRHLSIHPAAEVFGEMPDPVRSWQGVPQAYGYEHPEHPEVHFEGIFMPPAYGAIPIPFLGADLCDWMNVYDRLVDFGFFISDTKLGRVFGPRGLGPMVRYELTARDLDNFYFAIKLIASAFFAVGAKRVALPIINPRNVYHSEPELEHGFRRRDVQSNRVYAMAFHPLGTCRFAQSVAQGVVDASGRCHQHDNLYICDGSAIPGPLGVNPQITIMAFSRLAARNLA